jgi:hypothetical protein
MRIFARRTVVELRFKRALKYFRNSDTAGESLATEFGFPDWRRSVAGLALVSAKRFETAVLESDRVYVLGDAINDEREAIQPSFQVISKAVELLGFSEFDRIGVRQWFALEINGKSEEKLIKRLQAKYLNTASFENGLGLTISDHACTFEFKSKEDPRVAGRIELGAMKNASWPLRVPVDPNLVAHFNYCDSKAVLDKLPTDFVFLDVDRSMKKSAEERPLKIEDVREFIETVRDTQTNLPKQLIQELT